MRSFYSVETGARTFHSSYTASLVWLAISYQNQGMLLHLGTTTLVGHESRWKHFVVVWKTKEFDHRMFVT